MSNFAALGQRLRDAREAKELSPEEVERATRIRARFIEQLERGDFSGMTPVQAQGFLRNYARFLGIDLDLLETEITGQEPKARKGRGRRETNVPAPAAPATTPVPRPATRPESAPRRRRGWLTSTLIVLIAGAIVVLVVLGATALLNSISQSAEEDGVAAVDLSPETSEEAVESAEGDPIDPDATLAEGTPAAPGDGMAAPLTPELAYTPPGDTSTNVVVSVNVTQRTWLRVTVDGEVTRQGLARPGEVWQFEGEESVGLRASNAAALQLSVNNQRQGALGARGQLFDQTFTREGLAGSPTEAPSQPDTSPDDGLSLSPAPETPTNTASPEEAALVLSPTLDPDAPLPAVLEEGLARVPESVTPEPPTAEPATAEPPTPEPTTEPPTPEPPTLEPPTHTPLPPPPLSPLPSETPTPPNTPTPTPSPTASPTRTPTPLPSWTPSETPTPTSTATPSSTPFLPPRMTRTPTVSPK